MVYQVKISKLIAVLLAIVLPATAPNAQELADEVAELRQHRLMYEEARDAFEALRLAIERGYVALGET